MDLVSGSIPGPAQKISKMEIVGKLKIINETQSFGSNGFRKREIVLVTDDQYPQMLLIEFIQDKCDILNNYQVGQDVKIHFNLRGREWINPEGVAKYFNTIQGWRIEAITRQDFIPPNQEYNTPPEPDDLPF